MLSLLEGLNFIKSFQKGSSCYVKFKDGVLSTKKGNVEVGVPVDQDLNCVCDFQSLHQAVTNVDTEFTLTFMEGENKLKLSCESMQAEIEANSWEESNLEAAKPSENIAPLDDTLKAALKALVPTVKQNGKPKGSPKSFEISIKLSGGLAQAASKVIYSEYWHGNSMPPNLFVDLPAAELIHRIKSGLVGFGFNETSVTFHFANGEFVISHFSEIAHEEFPTWEKVNTEAIVADIEVPKDFIKECMKFAKMTGKEVLFINNGEMRPSNYHEVDTFLKTDIQVDGFIVNSKLLKALISPELMGINIEAGKAIFQGGVARSLIMLTVQNDTRDEIVEVENDDDAPF